MADPAMEQMDGHPADDGGERLRRWMKANPDDVKRIAAKGRRRNLAAFEVQADREFFVDMEADRQAAELAKAVAAS